MQAVVIDQLAHLVVAAKVGDVENIATQFVAVTHSFAQRIVQFILHLVRSAEVFLVGGDDHRSLQSIDHHGDGLVAHHKTEEVGTSLLDRRFELECSVLTQREGVNEHRIATRQVHQGNLLALAVIHRTRNRCGTLIIRTTGKHD